MQTIEKIREKVYRVVGSTHNPPKIYTDAQIDTKEDLIKVGKCVYRLWYGSKYIVWYGVSLWGSYFHFKRGFANWLPDMDVFHQRMYQYIYDHPRKEYKVELLFESDNEYHILKFQQCELDKIFIFGKDDACLNNETLAYLPHWNNASKKWGSFKGPAGRNFLKWIQSERYLKATTGW